MKKINFILEEEFNTTKPNLNYQKLKEIFNQKYYDYIKRQETRDSHE